MAREAAAGAKPARFTKPVQLKPLEPIPKAREATAEPLLRGDHLSVLRELHERTGQLRTTHDQIEEYMATLSKLPRREVVKLAADFGILTGADSKAGALRRIGDRLSERLGSAERGAEIEAVARGSK